MNISSLWIFLALFSLPGGFTSSYSIIVSLQFGPEWAVHAGISVLFPFLTTICCERAATAKLQFK